MDINVLRSMVTVAAFVVFVGILVWACLPSEKRSLTMRHSCRFGLNRSGQ